MNEKQRAEFEKWAKEKGCNTERHNDLNNEPLDWYACDPTDMAWEAWRAAIASQNALYVATYEKSEPIYLNKEFVKD